MSIPYRKILLPLDGSETAALALPYAQDLAAHSGAELVLYQVIPDKKQELWLLPEGQLAQPSAARQTELAERAGDQLQHLADDLALHHIPAKVILDTGDPASKIIDYATNHDIDLIVMSSHGRTGLARWSYGSVAAKVLGRAVSAFVGAGGPRPTVSDRQRVLLTHLGLKVTVDWVVYTFRH